MIKEITMFTVICDGCGKVASKPVPIISNAIFAAISCQDWERTEEDEYYCPSCYEIIDGEVVVKERV